MEPLQESEAYMRDLLTQRKGSYVLAALGSQPGTATITVDHRRTGKSSLLERTAITRDDHDDKERRSVPVTTLDTLLEERQLRGPFGLKIDTEGFELEVIRGATEFLKHDAGNEVHQHAVSAAWRVIRSCRTPTGHRRRP